MTPNVADIKTMTEAVVAAVVASDSLPAGTEVKAGILALFQLEHFAALPAGVTCRVAPLGPAADVDGTRDHGFDRVSFRVLVAAPTKAADMDQLYPLIQGQMAMREYLLLGPPPAVAGHLTEEWRIGGASVESVEFVGGVGEVYLPEALMSLDCFLSEMEVVLRHP